MCCYNIDLNIGERANFTLLFNENNKLINICFYINIGFLNYNKTKQ